ncbi:sialidase family protein [uncultured Pseudodesulfovibrio sp.]|uniref:sialidase family protein n=1 Tax=uncultured Pseudodesulfovibrio sp. TaxID=2035858 RepID=UPI0029C97C55|nr:sialidase family protein [uncultured Pseudodesulfovibrio sp.]
MPSLSDRADRHVVIDRREGNYLAFPDVIRLQDGRLMVAYNEADRHVRPDRRVLVVKTSRDNGATWSDPVFPQTPISHSPRLKQFPDGTILLSDSSRCFFESVDNGRIWQPFAATGLTHDMHDRILVLDDGSWLTAGHQHVGDEEHPAIRQPPTEQIVFRSTDRGRNWERLSVMAAERNLVLCEASMAKLPSGRILALLRENSFVFEPMYLTHSDDNGTTWSRPEPAALMGHRPTMGLLDDGRLLVTYRNTGPDWGTCAWLGAVEELASDFKVHGRAVDPANPIFTEEGMRVRNRSGNESVVRYALRPMTDPRTASLTLEAEVRVDQAEPNGCGIRVGCWWRLTPEGMVPDADPSQAVALPRERFNRLRFEYADGAVTAFVNGEQRAVIPVDPDHAETRPVMLGAPYPFENNAVDCTWKRVSLNILEPAYRRVYAWNWTAEDGLPDSWVRDHILELRNDRHAAAPDFGYSGWTRLDDGSFFCAYHHGGATEPGYEPLKTAYIAGTRFHPDDFKA